jgi:hypothetical protein
LIKDELDVKGSGAASFDSFYGKVIVNKGSGRKQRTCFFTLFADHEGQG